MEYKKQELIEILKQLEGHRTLTTGFLLIVKKTDDEKLIEELLKIIETGIKSIKDKRIRTKLAERIKELQRKGDLDQKNDVDEANSMLDEFINNNSK